jgi:hypothetical protein
MSKYKFKKTFKDNQALPESMAEFPPEPKTEIIEMKETKVEMNIKDIPAYLMDLRNKMIKKYSGKSNMNPYLWVVKNIHPLEEEYNTKGSSPELIRKVLALELTEPRV